MNTIKILSKNLINRIAAGEVLERPASAVKELIENSLDANAKKIDIFIRDGGKTEIKILDDGIGMKEKDLALSVKRHATSKLSNENLMNIKTLGFRGEALPSIGSVSKMKIITKNKEEEIGSEINLNGGEILCLKPCSTLNGTSVIIKDLFYTTPARLKFLKTEKYESFLIKKMIQKLALSNSDVEFNYYNNEKLVISTQPLKSQDKTKILRKRVLDLFGEEFRKNLLDFYQERDKFKFYGLIGLPTFHHSNNSNQFIFVNNRVVNDKLIFGFIKGAYRDYLSYDRFPQVVIFIDCIYDEVDINVHPTKSEVRFKDSNVLRSSIISSIRSTLSTAGHRASSTNTTKAINSFFRNTEPLNFSKNINHSNLEFSDLTQTYQNLSKNNSQVAKEKSINESEFSKNQSISQTLGQAKNQFHQTYIISETNDGIIIIDQHAAHERIVYEKLKKEFYEKKIQTQILLLPEIINCDTSTLNLVINFDSFLSNYGLVIEKFGKDAILVREIPTILAGCNIKQLIMDLVYELTEIGGSEILETQINKICSSMACHGSIRAGREMKLEEMDDLLRKMEKTPFSGQCNHGRPTYIELKLSDIERLFGRK